MKTRVIWLAVCSILAALWSPASSAIAGPPIAADQNNQTTIDAYISAWNAHDDGSAVANLFAEDGIYQDMANQQITNQVQGRDAIKDLVARQFQAFPNLELEVVSQGTGHIEFIYRGDNTGPFTFVDPPVTTGNHVEVQTVHVMVFNADGQIVAVREYYDGATVLSQLGLR